MDWATPQGLLLCWRHSVDILWWGDPPFTKKHERLHVPFVNYYWHCKCFNDGMTENSLTHQEA